MKKLGLIILMALVLTVGGVYATFDYARAEVDSVTTEHLAKGIAAATENTKKGTISIDVSQVLLKIDDTGSHKTGLGIGNSVIKVTFTPSEKAEPLVVDEGINMKLEISFTNNTYKQGADNYAVFTTTTAYGTGVTLAADPKAKKGDKFEYTVDLSEYLTVSEIPLPTLSDYNAFAGWFLSSEVPGNAVVTITVSEVK